ncbi:MAG: uroporphyrinogen decarboxylase family protein [Planctomycetota bacterium]
MKPVERIRAVLDFQPVDRLPCIEWAGWWNLTVDRWRTEGLPAALTDPGEIREHLGLDPVRQLWVAPRVPPAPSHGAGVVRTEADYEALLPALYPEPAFDPAVLQAWAERHARGELAVWLSLDGFFWYPRKLFGIEQHLYAFYDQPEFMHRMNRDLVAFNRRVLDEFCAVLTPEFMTFGEDMSYNHGPMCSRETFEAFLLPHYQEMTPLLRERGIRVFVDSDGMVEPLIPWFREAGVEGILPLERMAGVDVARIRRDHPDWRMIGGFDKTVMKAGEAAMRAEFERLLPPMRTGGFIPSVDHQTPPDVSLDLYRVYVRLLHEYAERAAACTCSG